MTALPSQRKTNIPAGSRAGCAPPPLALIARMLLPATLFAMSMLGILPGAAKARPAQGKPSADWEAAIAAPIAPGLDGARDADPVRHRKAVIVNEPYKEVRQ